MSKSEEKVAEAAFTRDTSGSRQRCNDNLSFKTVRIAYYPEDEEKMAAMSLEDRIDYCAQLKISGRYTVVDEEPEIPAAPAKPAKRKFFEGLLKRYFGK